MDEESGSKVTGKGAAGESPARNADHSAGAGEFAAASDSVQAAVAAIWQRSRNTVLERIAALDYAAAALVTESLGEEQRRFAAQEAHRLAGSMGTFGHAEASTIAKRAELMLSGKAPLSASDARDLAGMADTIRKLLGDEFERGRDA